jgi:uncharacterized protein YlxW (UPF0749 family)
MTPPTSHRKPEEAPTATGRRPDESMTLLTSMMERPLDPGYAAAAEERVAAGLPPATSTRTVAVLAAAIVVGLLFALGAMSQRRPDTAPSRARADLVRQIEARRSAADAQVRQVQTLQAEIDRLQTSALGGQQAALAERLAALSVVTGSTAVTGPGLTITLDDARQQGDGSADGDPRTQAEADEGRVLSKDLQVVTNGLWEAGAEAVAINGQRLTALSAIRFAGEAILVNYRPLTRPYVVTAIGSPQDLEVEFADSSAGSYVRALQDNYGVRVRIAGADKLTLPAATSLTVREAEVPRPAGSATATPSSGAPAGPGTTGTRTSTNTTTNTTEPAQ